MAVDDPPVGDEQGDVVERLPRPWVPVHRPEEQGRPPHAGDEVPEDAEGVVDEVLPVEQILRRIPDERQLGRDGEIRPEPRRLRVGVEDLPRVPREVADGRVELEDCDLHRPPWRSSKFQVPSSKLWPATAGTGNGLNRS